MPSSHKHIDKIRNFNRFYTNIIGVLDQHILKSPYSLSEVRILFEINKNDMCTARQIKDTLTIDEGYLSRIIEKFVSKGFIKKSKSPDDARIYNLSLTQKGKANFGKLNAASDSEIKKLIERLNQAELDELIYNMQNIIRILSKE